MRFAIGSIWVILTLAYASASSVADELPTSDEGIRVMSWNVSDDAFVSEQPVFQSLLLWGDRDVVLLDEVIPLASDEELVSTCPESGDFAGVVAWLRCKVRSISDS